jgi:hypothetical protein
MTMAKARIAVIGAGLMGPGIAQVFALAGHDVSIHDSIAANVDSAKARILANLKDLGDDSSAVERVRPTTDLAAAVREADYVVEAVLEDLPLKQKLFAEIETHVRPGTILASNTSVIPITKIMEGLRDRARALGTHWWNPPYLVPLVEVIGTQWTSPAAIDWTMALHKAAGKMPVHRDRGHCDQGELRPAACGLGSARKRRSRRHRSDARDSQNSAARYREPQRPLALSRSAGGRRQARLQIGRRLSPLERASASRAAGEGAATSQEGSHGGWLNNGRLASGSNRDGETERDNGG